MVTLPDGRLVPPPHSDERTQLESWLDFHRETLALKCSGLDDRQLRETSVEPSPLTLLGLLQHMTHVERNWFQIVLAGRDIPPVYTPEQRGGFLLDADRDSGQVIADWRAEVARAREATAAASLDDCGKLTEAQARFAGESTASLRWILVHMIEEYARHNGHADLIRERIDGVTGI
ncbi:DinB family protein [Streptomyces jumonjinensis]|uniref:DinB family protein n=1 Tax=Streptomyces jumonjinensis TaxID=1945 RepID=UPI003794F5EF